MLKAMPSPSGRNTEKLYYIHRRPPLAAYDEMPGMGDEEKLRLLEFLRNRLSPEDHRAVAKLLGADVDAAMDDEDGGPKPFKGMPEPGGTKFGQDARFRRPVPFAQRSFAQRFPHASKIRVSA
jgi:hypothetical protein